MEVTDQTQADRMLLALVRERLTEHPEMDCDAAFTLERTNLGYFAGYYDAETRLRVERLFDCAHPIFGPASEGIPTPEEAFAAGIRAGEKWKGQK